MTDVGFSVRVVPAGVFVPAGAKTPVARITLVLSPTLYKTGPRIELERWPEAVAHHLSYLLEADGVLQAARVASNGACVPQVETRVIGDVRAPSLKAILDRASAINAVWVSAMVMADPGPFLRVLEEADRSAQGGAAAGSPAPLAVAAPGRGDLAFQLTNERGAALIERLGGAPTQRFTGIGPRDDEELFQGERIRLASLDGGAATWGGYADAKAQRERIVQLDAKHRAARVRQALIDHTKALVDDYGRYLARRVSDPSAVLRFVQAPQVPAPGTAASRLKEVVDPQASYRTVGRLNKVHQAATATDDAARLNDLQVELAEESERVKERLFALETLPVIQRLFAMAVDLEIPFARFTEHFGDCTRPVYLRVGFGPPEETANWPPLATRRRTLAKLWYAALGNERRWSFFPCTREECDLGGQPGAVCPSRVATQVDGIVNLGAAVQRNGVCVPRYDIVSLDTVAAAYASQKIEDWNKRRQESAASPTVSFAAAREGEVSSEDAKRAFVTDPAEKKPSFIDRREIDLKTAGLALIDTGRREQACRAIAAAGHQAQTLAACLAGQAATGSPAVVPSVIDATDLTIGYRLDVGTTRGKVLAWRSLGARRIGYAAHREIGAPTTDAIVNEVVRTGPWRRQLEEATMRFSTRRVLGAGAEGDTLFTEEILGPWQGPPLGISADTEPGRAGNNVTTLDRRSLQVGTVYDLEDKVPERRIPPCRFGWRYHFGLRAVYAGGGAVTTEDAALFYEAAYEGRLALPQVDPGVGAPGRPWKAGRAFKRHERILPPVVTIPLKDALRGGGRATAGPSIPGRTTLTLANARSGGPTRAAPFAPPVEMSNHVVVRSWQRLEEGDRSTAGEETVAERVIMPASVSQAFADLHGAFQDDVETEAGRLFSVVDAGASVWPRAARPPVAGEPPKRQYRVVAHTVASRPRDGLKGVDYGAAWGGFPVLSNQRPDALGKPALDEDDTVDVLFGELPKDGAIVGDGVERAPSGDPVFTLARTDEGFRQQPYYPDPTAERLVLALRRVADDSGEGGVVKGRRSYLAVVDVPLYRAAGLKPASTTPTGFPDIVPVLLRVQRSKAGERSALLWADPTPQRYNPTNGAKLPVKQPGTNGKGRPGIIVQPVAVRLAPGEDYQIDLWCVPNAAALRHVFDPVEAAAAVAVDQGFAAAPAGDVDLAASAHLAQMAGIRIDVATLRATPPSVGRPAAATAVAPAGAGGLLLPSDALLQAFATKLHERMRREPVPEIAAVATLRVTHAIDRPLTRPGLVKEVVPAAGGTVRAVEPLRVIRAKPDDRRDRLDKGDARPADEEAGSTDVLLTGTVSMDLVQAGGVRILARGASAASGRFDAATGRASYDRASHIWPRGVDGAFQKGDRLFGFEVWPDGRVRLARETIPLLTVDQIALERFGAADLKHLDLFAAQKWALKQGAGVRASYPPAFPDGKARWIELTPVTFSRSASLMTSRYGERVENDERVGTPQHLWLRATRRPDKPSPLGARPVPVVDAPSRKGKMVRPHDINGRTPGLGATTPTVPSTEITVACSTLTRLYFQRPWFTCGEGERVGIVVWPPHLFGTSGKPSGDMQGAIDRNQVPPDPTGPDAAAGSFDVTRFEDSDLGPGGTYVTRWAADPIQGGPLPSGMLLGPRNFPQACEWTETPSADGRDPPSVSDGALVRSVAMPVPSGKRLDPTHLADRTLTVSLITFEPRFDPEQELWYTDVDIDTLDVVNPYVRLGVVRYQANARAELQVSEPEIVETYVRPRREVVVIATPASIPDGDLIVDVRVAGLGRKGEGSVEGMWAAEPIRPWMNCRILRSTPLADGVAVRHPTAAEPLRVEGELDAKGLSWTFPPIRLPADALSPGDGGVYMVVVDEVDRLRPTGCDDEATKPGVDCDDRVDSGPRFAARVVLRTAAMA